MGRLSKKPIPIPQGVTVREEANSLVFGGPKGEKKLMRMPLADVQVQKDSIVIRAQSGERQSKMNQGTMWAHVRNAIQGVAHGYSKQLEINGIGYRAVMEGDTLVLSLGFVHPIKYKIRPDVRISVEKNVITVSGADKESVGSAAAHIREFKKAEPYKGKGIRYTNEVVRRKSGKKALAAGAG
ncbi:MAG: 50S ribosomal protein L6 [Candidatus Liptonbacteria bacterium]|nr:50S ribosomal protein L6 [Candidatus Liptonbacteria bacterium]